MCSGGAARRGGLFCLGDLARQAARGSQTRGRLPRPLPPGPQESRGPPKRQSEQPPNVSNESNTSEAGDRAPALKGRISSRIALTIIGLVAVAAAVPAYHVQQVNEARVSCLSNQRRLSTALMLYAQDCNGCLPPPDMPTPGGWNSWVNLIDSYIRGEQDIAICASNPAHGAKHATLGYSYPYSYALNKRFFGVFTPGPFPVENVEIPEQTVLLAEAGRLRLKSPFGPPEKPFAMSAYTDTGSNPLAYPSPHDGRMNLATADGHAVSLRIAHYSTIGHDPQFGRVGGALFNWNGGHPNGDTAGPPRE